MSGRPSRNLKPLDYRKLNKGEWAYKEQQHNSSQSESSSSSSAPSLDQSVSCIQELDSDNEIITLFKSFTMDSDHKEPIGSLHPPSASASNIISVKGELKEAEARAKAEAEARANAEAEAQATANRIAKAKDEKDARTSGDDSDGDESRFDVVAEEEEDLEILFEEFGDFLDENKISVTVMNAEDYDAYVCRMEEYRKMYKALERKIKKKISLKDFKKRYASSFENALGSIKDCITEAKKRKANLRENLIRGEINEISSRERERLLKKIQDKEAVKFLMTEINRLIEELKMEFMKVSDVDDEELLRRKEDYPENTLQLDRLSSKIQQVHQILPEDYDGNEVEDMMTRYHNLLVLKRSYDANLDKMIAERELLKEKAFQTSALNIKLPKFKGHYAKHEYSLLRF